VARETRESYPSGNQNVDEAMHLSNIPEELPSPKCLGSSSSR
jgi:hypothetical protein